MSPPNPNRLTPFPLLLLLSLLCSSAISASIVTRLPGFQGALPFYLETGYVRVDEERGSELFYYFIKSEKNPSEDPLIIWLSGGPGCTAFNGLAFEIGPLEFVAAKYDGRLPRLIYRPNTWTKVANIIFLDCPPGAGFSFSRGGEEGDISTSSQVHTFLIKWLTDHPQFLSNPLYIAGNSYAGKYVPVIAQLVSEGIEAGIQPSLNLKGYIIGNPFTGDMVDFNSRVPYAHGMGIISDELYESIQRSCEGQDHRYPETAECGANIETFMKFFDEINGYYILDPRCPIDSPKPNFLGKNRRSLQPQEEHMELLSPPSFPDFKCRSYVYFLSYYWANNNFTRKALHVKEGSVEEWLRCRRDLPYAQNIPSNLMYQLNVTSKGVRALVMSGDHDMHATFLGTHKWIKSLNFPVVDEWRSWHVGGQVAGYTTTYSNNMTFATVKGAGHTAAEYKPKECLAMFRRWISYEPL